MKAFSDWFTLYVTTQLLLPLSRWSLLLLLSCCISFFLFLITLFTKYTLEKRATQESEQLVLLRNQLPKESLPELHKKLLQKKKEYHQAQQLLHRSLLHRSLQKKRTSTAWNHNFSTSPLETIETLLQETPTLSLLALPKQKEKKTSSHSLLYHFSLSEEQLFPLLERLLALAPAIVITQLSITTQEEKQKTPNISSSHLTSAAASQPSSKKQLFPPSLLEVTIELDTLLEKNSFHQSKTFSPPTAWFPAGKLLRALKQNLPASSQKKKTHSSSLAFVFSFLEKKPPLFSGTSYYYEAGKIHNLWNEPNLYPPISNHWIIKHHLDYTDPQLPQRDPDHDGFTNLEEWRGSQPIHSPGIFPTDPQDPKSHPPLWSKLHFSQKDLVTETYSFEFTGYKNDSAEGSSENSSQSTFNSGTSPRVFIIQPFTPLPRTTNWGYQVVDQQRLELQLGQQIANLPLRLIGYRPSTRLAHEIFYDTSLLLFQKEGSEQVITLPFHSSLFPHPTKISFIKRVTLHLTSLNTSKEEKLDLQPGETFSVTTKQLQKITTDLPIIRESNTSAPQATYQVQKITAHGLHLEEKETQRKIFLPIPSPTASSEENSHR